MSVVADLFKGLSLTTSRLGPSFLIPVRYTRKEVPRFVVKPKPGDGKSYRRIVHYPEEYTVAPLSVTNLAGRDPITGRKVCQGIGGGIKHKYHWIKWMRDGPAEGPPQEEKVIKIIKCGCRTSHVALVAVGDEMKYILATQNMKPGDIIKTSKFIPKIAITPNEGDAYPLGALPAGTIVHNIQVHPTSEYTLVHSAGCYATLKTHINGKALVQFPSKREMLFEPECMATVGRLSNEIHSSIPIGSPNRLRELGYRPRSGLKKKKTGRMGRKIKPLPPVQYYKPSKPEAEILRCTHEKFKL